MLTKRCPTLVLADDHPMMIQGLRNLLEPELEVVEEVMDGRALLDAARRWKPDLVITDISMPGIDGIEAARQLRVIVPAARVLILSVHAEPYWVHSAFDAGAWAYLTKASAPDEIETAVREVLQGRFYISPRVARAAVLPPLDKTSSGATENLTPRELQIVCLLGTGLGNKEIAGRLGVAVTTVRTHLNSVYDKLGSTSRVALALFAARGGGAV